MSILYDPQKRAPKPWTFLFFIVLTGLVAYFIYAYGDNKAKNMPIDPTTNSIFEKAEE